ncbi:hypothetical protein SNEBB_001920 [Seison nebaliae]|nr:hypothetical protein SNEBB_001920 [Seison nebaliae]
MSGSYRHLNKHNKTTPNCYRYLANEKPIYVIVTIALIALIILIISINSSRSSHKPFVQYNTTKIEEFSKLSNELNKELNYRKFLSQNNHLDKCNNFYEYSCKNWYTDQKSLEDHRSKYYTSYVGDKNRRFLLNIIESILENKNVKTAHKHEKLLVHYSQTIYHNCIEFSKMKQASIKKYLKEYDKLVQLTSASNITSEVLAEWFAQLHNSLPAKQFFQLETAQTNALPNELIHLSLTAIPMVNKKVYGKEIGKFVENLLTIYERNGTNTYVTLTLEEVEEETEFHFSYYMKKLLNKTDHKLVRIMNNGSYETDFGKMQVLLKLVDVQIIKEVIQHLKRIKNLKELFEKFMRQTLLADLSVHLHGKRPIKEIPDELKSKCVQFTYWTMDPILTVVYSRRMLNLKDVDPFLKIEEKFAPIIAKHKAFYMNNLKSPNISKEFLILKQREVQDNKIVIANGRIISMEYLEYISYYFLNFPFVHNFNNKSTIMKNLVNFMKIRRFGDFFHLFFPYRLRHQSRHLSLTYSVDEIIQENKLIIHLGLIQEQLQNIFLGKFATSAKNSVGYLINLFHETKFTFLIFQQLNTIFEERPFSKNMGVSSAKWFNEKIISNQIVEENQRVKHNCKNPKNINEILSYNDALLLTEKMYWEKLRKLVYHNTNKNEIVHEIFYINIAQNGKQIKPNIHQITKFWSKK